MENLTLDILIITYNRAELFEKTLISVCEQTYKDFTIKVFNNGSTDNTKEVYEKVIEQYPNRRFEYLELEENHLDEYFLQKKNAFITAEYVIVFHDDDLMHPRYVEHLIPIIKANPNVVLLGGKRKVSTVPENLEWDEPQGDYVIGSAIDLAKWHFQGDTLCYPIVCYKSDILKKAKYEENRFGNRADIPFLIEIAKNGLVCELQDRFIHYRISENQTLNNIPTLEQRMNWLNYFAQHLLQGDEEAAEILKERTMDYCTRLGYLPFKEVLALEWMDDERKKSIQKYFSPLRVYPRKVFYRALRKITSYIAKLNSKYTGSYFKYKRRSDILKGKVFLR